MTSREVEVCNKKMICRSGKSLVLVDLLRKLKDILEMVEVKVRERRILKKKEMKLGKVRERGKWR